MKMFYSKPDQYVMSAEELKEQGIARTDPELSKLFNKRQPILFTHSEDFDGIFSAAVVRKAFGNKVKIVPINFGDDAYKTILDDYDFRGRDVIVTDFSFEDDVMEKIAEDAHTFVWLDHHKTAIERICKLQAFKDKKILGLQTVKRSGAYLAWCFFYNGMKGTDINTQDDVPDIINWVSQYDTWTFKKADKEFMFDLQAGMKALDITFGNWDIADLLLYELNPEQYSDNAPSVCSKQIRQILEIGSHVNQYFDNYEFKTHVREAYDVKIKVGGKTLLGCCLNSPGYSQMFKYVYDPEVHDFCIKFHRIGNGFWVGSVYVMDDKKNEVDASKIAIEIAGPKFAGGHAGAAGWRVKQLPSFLK